MGAWRTVSRETLRLTVNNFLLNVTAVVAPSNSFTFGATTRNKKKGTATLTVNLPNPGELTASGKDVNVAGAAVISKAVTARTASLLIKARGKKKHKLNDTGKVKLNPAITYTPTGGDPSTQSTEGEAEEEALSCAAQSWQPDHPSG